MYQKIYLIYLDNNKPLTNHKKYAIIYLNKKDKFLKGDKTMNLINALFITIEECFEQGLCQIMGMLFIGMQFLQFNKQCKIKRCLISS